MCAMMIKKAAGKSKNNSHSLKAILQNISAIPILNSIIGLKEWWCFL
jgi:hypothetical protein